MDDADWFDRITEEHGSLEKYIKFSYDSGANDAIIRGYTPFKYLWEKTLLQENDIIRVSWRSNIDKHYSITADGKLEGVKAQMYSGDLGIHEPKKILSLKYEDNFWTLGNFAKIRIIRSLQDSS